MLGPLLFYLYINKFSRVFSGAAIRLYADDTVLDDQTISLAHLASELTGAVSQVSYRSVALTFVSTPRKDRCSALKRGPMISRLMFMKAINTWILTLLFK